MTISIPQDISASPTKIIDGSWEHDPVERWHWYENEYRLWPSTDSHLCRCVPFNLSAWRVAPLPRGLSDSNGKRAKGKRVGKRRDSCRIAGVEYVERITRSSRTESPDQLHNGATETDALQPPPRTPLPPSRPKHRRAPGAAPFAKWL